MKRFAMLLLVGLASAASADPRPWTFTYDLYPEGKGNWEYEQWVTFKHGTKGDSGANSLEFRYEFEVGITDYFDLSVYVANWNWEDNASGSRTHYESSGVEGIVYLSKPTDAIGIALYGEANIGHDFQEYEGKVLFQKDIGPWAFAYNLIFETEVERVRSEETGKKENEVTGELSHALAASYSVNKNWKLGAELLIESIFEDWSHYDKTNVFLGPSFAYNGGPIAGSKTSWWVTATPMFQLTDNEDEPRFQLRVLLGLEF